MRKPIMIAAAAALAAALPALADAKGRGSGKGQAAHAHQAHPHGCPPGLAKRHPRCVPPGQARRLFRQGQRLPARYAYYADYDDIPVQYRARVPEGYRYVYRDHVVYVVDPTTRLVRSIIDLID